MTAYTRDELYYSFAINAAEAMFCLSATANRPYNEWLTICRAELPKIHAAGGEFSAYRNAPPAGRKLPITGMDRYHLCRIYRDCFLRR